MRVQVESCSRGKREKGKKAVAVKASRQKVDLDKIEILSYPSIHTLFSDNKDTSCEESCVEYYWAEDNGTVLLLYRCKSVFSFTLHNCAKTSSKKVMIFHPYLKFDAQNEKNNNKYNPATHLILL